MHSQVHSRTRATHGGLPIDSQHWIVSICISVRCCRTDRSIEVFASGLQRLHLQQHRQHEHDHRACSLHSLQAHAGSEPSSQSAVSQSVTSTRLPSLFSNVTVRISSNLHISKRTLQLSVCVPCLVAQRGHELHHHAVVRWSLLTIGSAALTARSRDSSIPKITRKLLNNRGKKLHKDHRYRNRRLPSKSVAGPWR